MKTRLLLKHFHSAQAILSAPQEKLKEIVGLGDKIITSLKTWNERDDWQRDLDLVHRYNAQLIPYTDPQYPPLLRKIPDAPVLLYAVGSLTEQDFNSTLAIIGTRACSHYGKESAERLSAELAGKGITIISGLALGIDAAAHVGALKSGRTIAVIGSGLAQMYPKENIHLASKIAEKGAVLSEYPMFASPDRQHFPQRNRIVSGMSCGVLLIEAPSKSGSMITINKARSQGKPCFAIPGRIDQSRFQGNHQLLKSREAHFVDCSTDILQHLDMQSNLFEILPEKPKGPELSENEKNILSQMSDDELSIEDLISITKLPITKLNVLLMGLVLKKVIKEYPGKLYRKAC